MSNAFLKKLPLLAATAALLAPGFAMADPAKSVQVLGRALTFLENGPTGRATVGVVFDPSKPASVSEKDAVMAAIGSGLNAGGLTIVAAPIPVSAVGGAGGVAALYITNGVNFAAVGAAAKAKKIVTVGDGSACVTSGACVMGVTTVPKVEITVNRAAAAAVGATFKAAFRMMIKEI